MYLFDPFTSIAFIPPGTLQASLAAGDASEVLSISCREKASEVVNVEKLQSSL